MNLMNVKPYIVVTTVAMLGYFFSPRFALIFFAIVGITLVAAWGIESSKFANYYKINYPVEYNELLKKGGYALLEEFKPKVPDEDLQRNQKEFKLLQIYLKVTFACLILRFILGLFRVLP